MIVYMKVVIIMVFEESVLPHKNLLVKRAMFPHRNIHECCWTSTDGKRKGSVEDF
jgi:hypothetical protein